MNSAIIIISIFLQGILPMLPAKDQPEVYSDFALVLPEASKNDYLPDTTLVTLTEMKGRFEISNETDSVHYVQICGLKQGEAYHLVLSTESGGVAVPYQFDSTENSVQSMAPVPSGGFVFTASGQCELFQLHANPKGNVQANSKLMLSVGALKQAVKKKSGNRALSVIENIPASYVLESLFDESCIDFFNVSAIGPDVGRGIFTGGEGVFGFNEGVVLSTGNATSCEGPNTSESTGSNLGGGSDPDLTLLASFIMFDVVGVEFDFVPYSDLFSFEFVFGSEEYCEWEDSNYNDIFGIFLSGPEIQGPFSNNAVNLATVPGTGQNSPISVKSINPIENTDYFNPNSNSCGAFTNPNDIEFDGYTVPVSINMSVNPLDTYHLRIVIGDVGDGIYDSGIFLKSVQSGDSSNQSGISCLFSIVYLDSISGTATLDFSDVAVSQSGTCLSDWSIEPSVFDCATTGAYDVEVTAISANGDTLSCYSEVYVLDTSQIALYCTNVLLHSDENGQINLDSALVSQFVNSTCELDSFSFGSVDFDCTIQDSTYEVQLTIWSSQGNSDSCAFFAEVTDTTLPQAVCRQDTLVLLLNEENEVSLSPEEINSGSSDNCGLAVFEVNQTVFGCDQIGFGSVILQVTDNAGNKQTCEASIEIRDTVHPIAVCVPEDTIYLGWEAHGAGFPIPINDGDIFQIPFLVAGYQLADLSDPNQGLCGISLQFTHQYVGDLRVRLISPAGQSIVLIGSVGLFGETENTLWDVRFVPCDTMPLPDANQPGVWSNDGFVSDSLYTGSYHPHQGCLEDLNEGSVNGMWFLQIEDIQAIDNGQILGFSLEFCNGEVAGNQSGQQFDAGSEDNCGITEFTLQGAEFLCDAVGTVHTVSVEVIDAGGLSDTCEVELTVLDSSAPFVLCRDVEISIAEEEMMLQSAELLDTLADNCEIDTVYCVPESISCSDVGAVVDVELFVSDPSGNASVCTSQVHVIDETPPLALCADFTLSIGEDGKAVLSPEDIDAGSFDACSGVMGIISQEEFDCGNINAPQIVFLTVTDDQGNASTCIAQVAVVDLIPPVMQCVNVTVELDASGAGSVNLVDVDAGSTDNCGLQNLWLSDSQFDCSDHGQEVPVWLYGTDASGNTDSCLSKVYVYEDVAPLALCRQDTLEIELSAQGQTQISPEDIDDGSTDYCGPVSEQSISPKTFDCSDVGLNGVTLTVVDLTGRYDVCDAVVRVIDPSIPFVVCQPLSRMLDSVNTQVTVFSYEFEANSGSIGPCDNIINRAYRVPGHPIADSFALSHLMTWPEDEGVHDIEYKVTTVDGKESMCATTLTLGEPTTVSTEIQVGMHDEFESRIFPNPFRNSILAEYELTKGTNVHAALYSIQGGFLKELEAPGSFNQGTHLRTYDLSALPAGVYVLRIRMGHIWQSHRIVKM